MIPLLRNTSQQKPLFHIIHEDDIYLLNTDDAEWFQILYHFRYERYVGFGVAYYHALHEFNREQAREGEERGDAGETKEEARQRLLFRECVDLFRDTSETSIAVNRYPAFGCPLL